MTINKYLIISPGKKTWNPNVKLANSLKGQMQANAIALKLNLEIPDSIFKKPQLEATIKIDEKDISKPIIKAETIDNIKEVISQQLGIDLNINIVTPTEG